jgi:hypothetical protein
MSGGASRTPVTIAQPATTIDGVLQRMTELESSLPRTDGVAYFNRLYLAVTEAIQKGVAGVTFEDEDFLTRLDVVFGNLFFKALADWEARQESPAAWRPLFSEREHAWRRPVQFALCGMNAHINHDLPLAVCQAFGELGGKPVMDSPQYRDFMRVNEVLRQVESQVKEWFLSGLVRDLDRVSDDDPDKLAMWSIADARAVAWHHARTLWRLRGHPDLERDYLDALSTLVDVAGRGILI